MMQNRPKEKNQNRNCWFENFIEDDNENQLNNKIEESTELNEGHFNSYDLDSIPEIIYMQAEINNSEELKKVINCFFNTAMFLVKLKMQNDINGEDNSFEKRMLQKRLNKDYLTKLWKENVTELLVEKNDQFVDVKFAERINWLKETFFNDRTSNENEKIEDYNEWCRDKDIVNISIFMKGLSEHIKLKIETETSLRKELEKRKILEIKYKQRFHITSDQFNQIRETIINTGIG